MALHKTHKESTRWRQFCEYPVLLVVSGPTALQMDPGEKTLSNIYFIHLGFWYW